MSDLLLSLSTVNAYLSENKLDEALETCNKIDENFLGFILGKLISPSKDFTINKIYNSAENKDGLLEDKSTGQNEDMITTTTPDVFKIKLMCNWCSNEDLVKLWCKMSQDGLGKWDNIQLTSRDPADYYVIINSPPPGEYYDPKKTVIFRMEPYMELHQKWGAWSRPDSKNFLKVIYHNAYLNNIEWHLNKSYTELINTIQVQSQVQSQVQPYIIKNKILSTVLSEKYHDPGHARRIDFVKFLEKNNVEIDVYGNNKWEYKNYCGALPYHNKDNAIFPYKYTFNAENHNIMNYVTEKLVDGILGECLVFYCGAFNAREYIDKRAFVQLNLTNFDHDMNIIKKAIAEDWHTTRLPYIRQAKEKILRELQFFPRLSKIINEAQNITS